MMDGADICMAHYISGYGNIITDNVTTIAITMIMRIIEKNFWFSSSSVYIDTNRLIRGHAKYDTTENIINSQMGVALGFRLNIMRPMIMYYSLQIITKLSVHSALYIDADRIAINSKWKSTVGKLSEFPELKYKSITVASFDIHFLHVIHLSIIVKFPVSYHSCLW